MKKLLLSFVAGLLFSLGSYGQHYDLGDANLCIGLAPVSLLQGETSLPVVGFTFSYGLFEDTDNVAAGLFLGYGSSSDRTLQYSGDQYTWDYSYLFLAGRGYYYLASGHNFHLFGVGTVGYQIVSSEYSTPDGVSQRDPQDEDGLVWGVHLGGRYYFNRTVGAFLEGGYGSMYAMNLGLSLRF